LQYAGERYGGLRPYLELIGFSRLQQAELRAALTDPDPWPAAGGGAA
jgi:hypothetical protein